MIEKMELADAGLRHAEGLSAQFDKPDWKPSRAHVEQARNTIRKLADLIRASSPAQEPVTTEPVADIDQMAQSFQKWRAEHTRNFYLPWSSLDERQQEHVREEVRTVLALAIPAPPQPGREEIAKIVYDAFDFSPTMGTPHKPEWMPGGNSFMQDRARRAANAILDLT